MKIKGIEEAVTDMMNYVSEGSNLYVIADFYAGIVFTSESTCYLELLDCEIIYVYSSVFRNTINADGLLARFNSAYEAYKTRYL